MYCASCGGVDTFEQNFCTRCGSSLRVEGMPGQTAGAVEHRPVPVALIAITWMLFAFSLIPMGIMNSVFFISLLMCGIYLIISRNKIATINGWLVIGLVFIVVFVGFLLGRIELTALH